LDVEERGSAAAGAIEAVAVLQLADNALGIGHPLFAGT
jgi:hypothetical protein